MAKQKNFTAADIIALRQKLNLNQTSFWSRCGVGQSCGSRYESGRKIAKPVQMLLRIAYGTNVQAQAMIDALRKRGDGE